MIKKFVEKLNYDVIEFPLQEKGFNKMEVTNNICISVFWCGKWVGFSN